MDVAEEPRWLTEEEASAWVGLATMLFELPTALDAQLQRDAGISHFEYQVLAMLSMASDRTLRMTDLAALANGSLTRLSRVVDRLEDSGWVCRRPGPTDGRSRLAVLTAAGWEKVKETAPGHVAEVRRLIFDQLTKGQVRQLEDIGSRVLGAIGTERLAPRRS